jgi:hypothetical protein
VPDRKPAAELYAVVAEFRDPDALLQAVARARDGGFRRLEAFSPFPVEGLAQALGFRERAIAPIMLAGGIVGALGGFGLQVATNLDFPLNVGGRPVVTPQAFALITFELLFLGAALFGVLAMLLLNGLPRLHHPLFEIADFHFAGSDKFFLAILADGRGFDAVAARRFLKTLQPVSVADAPFAEAPR